MAYLSAIRKIYIAINNKILNKNLLFSSSWKNKKFKDYNLDSLGAIPRCGHLHPLQKVRTEMRKIFLEMGSGFFFLI